MIHSISTIINFKLTINKMKQIKTKSIQTNQHNNNHLKMREAPLPSPVPTGKGLRSSVINDEILSDFLTASLQIPDLKLPITFQSRHVPVSPVDYRSIVSGDCDAIESARKSASEFGFFVVSGHGVTATDEEVRERNRRREAEEEFDFCWAGEEEENEGSEFDPDFRSDPNLRNCFEKKEAELIKVGKSLSKIFCKGATSFGTIQAKATSSLVILNCNVDYQLSRKTFSNDDDNVKHCENDQNALSLYLISIKCEILVQTDTESYVFQAVPDTIVAILGQQLEVDGNVKKLPRKLRFLRPVEAQGSASHHPLIVSIGLKLDSVISISDQIIAAALIILLFQFGLWFYKCVQSL